MNESTAAAHANRATAAGEFNYRNGYDLHLGSELADWAAEQEAADEFWEREGRAEMYAALELDTY